MSVFFVVGDSFTHSVLSVTPHYDDALEQGASIGKLIGDDMVSVVAFPRWLDVVAHQPGVVPEFLEPAHDLNNAKARLDWSLKRWQMANQVIAQNSDATGDEHALFVCRYEGVGISNPAMSPCGRFGVTPLLQYGLDYLNWFNALNPTD